MTCDINCWSEINTISYRMACCCHCCCGRCVHSCTWVHFTSATHGITSNPEINTTLFHTVTTRNLTKIIFIHNTHYNRIFNTKTLILASNAMKRKIQSSKRCRETKSDRLLYSTYRTRLTNAVPPPSKPAFPSCLNPRNR